MSARTLLQVLVAAVAAKLALDHFADPDTYWHLYNGFDFLARGGGFPKTIEHCWMLVNEPFVSNDWLVDLGMALFFKLGGVPVLAVAKGVAAAVFGLILFRASLLRAEGHAVAAGIATLVLLFVAATHFGTRPALIGYTCLAAEIVLLEKAVKGARWAMPLLLPLFALWFNVHGTWALGLGPLAAAAGSALLPRLGVWRLRAREVEPGVRRWIVGWAFVAPLGVFATPFDATFVLRPFRMLYGQAHHRRDAFNMIEEWMPVPYSRPEAWILLGGILLTVWACARSRRPLPLFETLLAALLAVMALKSARYHIGFAVVAAPLLAQALADRLKPDGLAKPRLNAMIAAAALPLLLLVAGFRVAHAERDTEEAMPVEAVRVLKDSGRSGARGFNYFDWGGYLVFSGVGTFIDGRTERILEEVFLRYLEIQNTRDVAWLEGQGVRWVLDRPDTPIAEAMAGRAGWREAFRDERSVLWLAE